MPRPIDADALISKIAFHRDSLKPYNVVAVSAFDAVIDFIKRRPTVSPDEVRGVGKWEDVSVHDNIRNIMIASMRCNVCKRYHNEVYHYGNPTEMARFCPVCGAKMEVSEDA